MYTVRKIKQLPLQQGVLSPSARRPTLRRTSRVFSASAVSSARWYSASPVSSSSMFAADGGELPSYDFGGVNYGQIAPQYSHIQIRKLLLRFECQF